MHSKFSYQVGDVVPMINFQIRRPDDSVVVVPCIVLPIVSFKLIMSECIDKYVPSVSDNPGYVFEDAAGRVLYSGLHTMCDRRNNIKSHQFCYVDGDSAVIKFNDMWHTLNLIVTRITGLCDKNKSVTDPRERRMINWDIARFNWLYMSIVGEYIEIAGNIPELNRR